MDMGISLSEALGELRRELYAAQAAGSDQQFRFEVEQAELSLEVEFRRDANGGVKVEVGLPGAKIGGEAGSGAGSTRRQMLTLTLQVRDEALGGQRARIRRSAGGLDVPGDDGPGQQPQGKSTDGESDASRKSAQPRPWEA
ncbi:trypco2 family protein [Streptomyces sp. NPDC052687]|uniref:trypco2 family protein n=1 Tax=Streptomyces sp. NPDC052687 TaxID=3154759 RepID=UPI00343AA845